MESANSRNRDGATGKHIDDSRGPRNGHLGGATGMLRINFAGSIKILIVTDSDMRL